MKWIIYALMAWLLWRLLQRWQRDPPASPAEKSPECMVRCQSCGLNLPVSEAVQDAGTFYCSEAHKEEAAEHSSHLP